MLSKSETYLIHHLRTGIGTGIALHMLLVLSAFLLTVFAHLFANSGIGLGVR